MMANFPNKFLWGASISAYQAEGAIEEDGRKLSVADLSTRKPGYADNSVTSDFYHHYKEDIALLAEMGGKVFRFSLAWPRIMPDGEGSVNEAGIQFYNDLLDELEKYNIEPVVTMFHYDLPVALQEKYGGWKNRKVVDAFEKYAEVCFREFGNRIKKWLTINEPDILMMYGGHGLDIDGKEEFNKNKLIINHHFAVAHAKAVNLCHNMLKDAIIGPVFGYVPVYPKSCKPEDVIAAKNIHDIQNGFFQELFLNGYYMEWVFDYLSQKAYKPVIVANDMDLIKNAKSDFVALNYYKSDVAMECLPDTNEIKMDSNTNGIKGTTVFPKVPGKYELCANPFLERTNWDWEIDPVGIRVMLREVYFRYRIPIIITENGVAAFEELSDNTVNDDYRIEYLQKHIEQCKLAIGDGVNLIGYCVWSFIDLLSTGHGFLKRYGLVYINRNNEDALDLKRFPKKSYFWYKKVIQENGNGLFV